MICVKTKIFKSISAIFHIRYGQSIHLLRLGAAQSMKVFLAVIFIAFFLFISACQPVVPVCPPGSITYISEGTQFSSSPLAKQSLSLVQVDINGKLMVVDDVINGPLCDSKWSGTIYVGCDLQICEWQEDPTFLKDCSLSIETGTVVYVAAHNDAPYYKGCACHTGEDSH